MTNHDDRNYNKELYQSSIDETFQEEQNRNHQENNTSQEFYRRQPELDETNNSEENSELITTTVNNSQTESVKRSKPKGKWSMFVSGLSGGLVVAVTGAVLLGTGVLQQPDSTNEVTETTETPSSIIENDTSNDVIPTSATNDDGSLSEALSRVSDAVVGVSNIQQTDLWSQSEAGGTGSGVIYKQENGSAYVVTNNHVVEGGNSVEVILTNGDQVEAEVLGVDELTDLAVLKIDDSKVTQVATLGSSANLGVGETAIAIGNPLGTEFAGSVTKGIISGLERSVEMDLNSDGQADWTTEVIQTDAAINPGNSGGALINSQGELIGINSMKIAQEAVEGIGFAIPIDSAKPIIDQLETSGNVARPFIGISAVALNTVPDVHKQRTLNLDQNVTEGIVVADTGAGTPADTAGLEQYDVITKINDKEITSMIDLKQYLYNETEIGEEITITYYRDGQEQTTSLNLSNQEESSQQTN
ncbi:S1C family serine protease [Aquibacillus rhizosphaerae]|uniref:S1C family serine protease n=1 Tax=Aquibacillus rhizosphaerae TaxID=3051431 RepID=A0ABT7L5D6_9BACI|nr:S1C family serine protease [Aquibacillus sp. LR5S19]MDL4841066.1 S1C family serine protease [Aquibacillus sp. LR5S19]